MEPVVKGSDLPVIYGKSLNRKLKIMHYVYPERHYGYFMKSCGDCILVNNEFSLFKRDIAHREDLRLYPVDTEYFLFNNSFNKNIKKEIFSGNAFALSMRDAEHIHQSLLAKGMLCVFPDVRQEICENLFNSLVRDLDMSRVEITPNMLASDVFGSRSNLSQTDRFLQEIMKMVHSIGDGNNNGIKRQLDNSTERNAKKQRYR